MDIQKIALTDALEQIAPGSSQYIEEDTIGGFHLDPKQAQWPIGAIWGVEGQFLYALVRHFKPNIVLELGTGRGAGSAHLGAAVAQNKNNGGVFSVDSGVLGFEPYKTKGVEYVTDDAIDALLAQDDNSIDFIFEDLDHHAETVQDVAMLALQKLAPGGILVSHDAAHWVVGEAVRKGYAQAGLEPLVFLMPPSDCGVSFWRKTGEHEYNPPAYDLSEAQEAYPDGLPDYSELTTTALKALLDERGIEYPARAKKQEYIDLLTK